MSLTQWCRLQQMCTYQYRGEWYFSHRSAQMSDLSGFKKLHINMWEHSNISHRTRVWKSSQWDDVKKKKRGGGWRQMYTERCRCEEGRESKEEGEKHQYLNFFSFVVGFLLLLWEIKTNYVTQLTCPPRFLRNCGSAWHWSASYKGNVGGWWCNASPLWGHASLSCQAESTLCTSTYRRPWDQLDMIEVTQWIWLSFLYGNDNIFLAKLGTNFNVTPRGSEK